MGLEIFGLLDQPHAALGARRGHEGPFQGAALRGRESQVGNFVLGQPVPVGRRRRAGLVLVVGRGFRCGLGVAAAAILHPHAVYPQLAARRPGLSGRWRDLDLAEPELDEPALAVVARLLVPHPRRLWTREHRPPLPGIPGHFVPLQGVAPLQPRPHVALGPGSAQGPAGRLAGRRRQTLQVELQSPGRQAVAIIAFDGHVAIEIQACGLGPAGRLEAGLLGLHARPPRRACGRTPRRAQQGTRHFVIQLTVDGTAQLDLLGAFALQLRRHPARRREVQQGPLPAQAHR